MIDHQMSIYPSQAIISTPQILSSYPLFLSIEVIYHHSKASFLYNLTHSSDHYFLKSIQYSLGFQIFWYFDFENELFGEYFEAFDDKPALLPKSPEIHSQQANWYGHSEKPNAEHFIEILLLGDDIVVDVGVEFFAYIDQDVVYGPPHIINLQEERVGSTLTILFAKVFH